MPITGLDSTGTKRVAKRAWVLKDGVRIELPGIWALSPKYGKYDVLDHIPSSLLIMYPTDADVPADASVWASEQIMPRGALSDIGTYAGSWTHSGSEHGGDTPSISTRSNYRNVWRRTLGSSGYRVTQSSHGHSSSNHTHSSSENITPPWFGLIPTQGGAVVGANAVFMSDRDLASNDGWVEQFVSLGAQYLMFVLSQSSVTTGGYSSHGHSYVNWTTGTYTATLSQESYLRGIYFYQKHYHNARSYMSTSLNRPPANNLPFFSPGGVVEYNSQIPEGCITWCTATNPPPGWEVYYPLVDRFAMNDPNGGSGVFSGSQNHTHTSNTNQTINAPTSYRKEYQSSGDYYAVSTGDHTVGNGGHGGSGNLIPRHVNLLPVIKV